MKKLQDYFLALMLGLLTIIICVVIADGIFGIRGSISNFTPHPDGSYTFSVNYSDPTGRIAFWVGMLVLSVLYAFFIPIKSTLVNIPFYTFSFAILNNVFKKSLTHGILPRSPEGFVIYLFNEKVDYCLSLLFDALYLFIIQLAIFFLVKTIIHFIKKLTQKKITE